MDLPFIDRTHQLQQALHELGPGTTIGLIVSHRNYELRLTTTRDGGLPWIAYGEADEADEESDLPFTTVEGKGITPLAALDACADAIGEIESP